jgi:hypothetical protein
MKLFMEFHEFPGNSMENSMGNFMKNFIDNFMEFHGIP